MTSFPSNGDWLDEQARGFADGRTVWHETVAELDADPRDKRIVAEILDPFASTDVVLARATVYRPCVEAFGRAYRVSWDHGRETCTADSWEDGLDTVCSEVGGIVGDLRVEADPDWLRRPACADESEVAA